VKAGLYRVLLQEFFARFGIDEAVLRDHEGLPRAIRATLQDIADRKRAEEEKEKMRAQLNQARKMESVGRPAGGVGHDFDNVLGILMGNSD
jgi:phosphoglycerate-specific signal transduction histidine kinase